VLLLPSCSTSPTNPALRGAWTPPRILSCAASMGRLPRTTWVRGPDAIRELVGRPAGGGWTEPVSNAVLAAVNDSVPPSIRHELGHLYSHCLWGRPHAVRLSDSRFRSNGGNFDGTSRCGGAGSDTRTSRLFAGNDLCQLTLARLGQHARCS
jgi:hypothetical protein